MGWFPRWSSVGTKVEMHLAMWKQDEVLKSNDPCQIAWTTDAHTEVIVAWDAGAPSASLTDATTNFKVASVWLETAKKWCLLGLIWIWVGLRWMRSCFWKTAKLPPGVLGALTSDFTGTFVSQRFRWSHWVDLSPGTPYPSLVPKLWQPYRPLASHFAPTLLKFVWRWSNCIDHLHGHQRRQRTPRCLWRRWLGHPPCPGQKKRERRCHQLA